MAGHFHKMQKMSLFSIPFKGSKTNFALDAIREMEHKDASKGFRPRSEPSAVLPRMCLVDTFNEIEERKRLNESDNQAYPNPPEEDVLKWTINDTDFPFIARGVSLLI